MEGPRRCARIAAGARFVRIDLDRVGDVEPGPAPALDPERHYLEGPPDDVAYSARARRDQLRLGLVPDAAQAGGLLGLLHRRLGARGPLARARCWTKEELPR